jgi:ribosomal-protein-alanine N-acetyltransferase
MEIEVECFPTPWHESAYLTELANRSAHYIVACADSRIVGYAGMWIIMDEAHITTLGVARDCRGTKIGEQLLVRLLDEAMRRGARRATLEVRQSNAAAQSLYRKYGFVAAAIRRGYYTDNRENAVVMWIDNVTSPSFTARYETLKHHLRQRQRAPAAEVSCEDIGH